MQRVTLSHCGIQTSAAGFGTASLMTAGSVEHAVGMLHRAYDLGVTHIDTARLYSQGHAEGAVGAFLAAGARDRVTVTAKVGLEPDPALSKHRRLVGLARRVVRAMPALQGIARHARGMMMSNRRVGPTMGPRAGAPDPRFDPATVTRSFETSLRELRTDHVDLLLLHECAVADTARDDLLAWLQDRVARGQARQVGIGTAAAQYRGAAGQFSRAYRVVQFADSPAEPNRSILRGLEERDVITHSAIVPARRLAAAAAALGPGALRALSANLDTDAADPSSVAGLLLRWALARNAGGIVLFATTSPERLASNVRAIELGPLDPSRSTVLERFAASVLGPASLATQPPG